MIRPALTLTLALLLGACAAAPFSEPPVAEAPAEPPLPPEVLARYRALQDGDEIIPAVPLENLSARNVRQEVDYWTDHPPGTIIVDPHDRFLYLVEPGNRALRYGVAVGEAGFQFTGEARIPYQRDWPRWTPTQNMIASRPDYAEYAGGVPGGIDNPLGARALYLHRDGRDTLYRIHGTPQPWTVGQAVSSGCIRLYNQDIIDLAARVRSGTRVVVLGPGERGQGTTPPEATRNTGVLE